jgi:uracil-DNA glycosylase family 4
MNNEILKKLVRYSKFNQEYSSVNAFGKELNELLANVEGTVSSVPKTNHVPTDENEDSGYNKRTTIKIEDDQANSMITDEWEKCDNLSELSAKIQGCEKCGMLSKGRKNIVFGSGNPNAEIVVVGEAPGADEDEQGLPFVGRAGRLLTDILAAINLSRDEVYICNILKCRPPENRNPQPEEISNCEPYLSKQLELIKPKLILALGTFAAQTLLGTREPLGKLRGKFHLYKNTKLLVTYHPAALLRNPNWKRPTWEDVKMLREEYDNINRIINERS